LRARRLIIVIIVVVIRHIALAKSRDRRAALGATTIRSTADAGQPAGRGVATTAAAAIATAAKPGETELIGIEVGHERKTIAAEVAWASRP
jgi:hypothetical protein